MNLAQWIEFYDLSMPSGRGARTDLYRRTGLTYKALASILKGDSQPRAATLRLLEAATGGKATYKEMSEELCPERPAENMNFLELEL